LRKSSPGTGCRAFHLVSAGRPGFDRAHLQSPRLTLAIDALLRVYDHVLLDAGSAFRSAGRTADVAGAAVVVPTHR
jgi:hypothetical protein